MGFSAERHRRALPVDVPDRHRADRPEHALRDVAARLEVDERGADLAADQPRPHAARSRRRSDRRADRSRSTRPASKPTRPSSRSRRRRSTATVIWAGSDDGLVHVTRDGGKNWTPVTPPDLPQFTRISLIDASPHDPGDGLSRRQSLSAVRPRALRLQDERLRQDVDEDRRRASRRRLPPRRFAKIRSAAGCCSSARRPAIYVSFDDGGALAVASRLDLPVTPVHGIQSRTTTS